jgi:Mce-associated membrane protein
VAVERSSDQVTTWSARPRVIAVIAAVTAIGVVLALVGWLLLPNIGGDDDDAAERNQLTARATDFAVTYNTYDVADLADYQKRLKSLLTPAYNKQLVEITDAVFGAIETKKQKSGDAKVRGVAIDTIDDDSAVVLVAVDASITNTDNEAAVERRFRWKISFNKNKSGWQVSNFESVASVEAQASPAPADPSAGAPAPSTPAPAEGSAGDQQ